MFFRLDPNIQYMLTNKNCYCTIFIHSLVDELRCLTAFELYLYSEFYGKHCCFESAEFPQRAMKHMKTNEAYEDKHHDNFDVAAFNPIQMISYQILLKHQVFIMCIMMLFQIVLLCLLFRSKEHCPCHRDERNH